MALGVLDAILGARASTRLAVVLLLLCGFAAYTRFQVANLPRRSSALLEWVEDTVEGAAASHVAPQRHTPLYTLWRERWAGGQGWLPIPPRSFTRTKELHRTHRTGHGTGYRVLSRAAASAGGQAVLEVRIQSGAPGFFPRLPGSSLYHSHDEQEEAWAVLEGTLGYSLDGVQGELAAGETLLVPAGAKHSTWAAHGEPLRVQLTLSPPGPMGEHYYEALAGLGASYGDVTRIHPLQLVVLLEAAGVRVAGVPAPLDWAMRHVLAPFARLAGFQPTYAAYVSAGAPSSI